MGISVCFGNVKPGYCQPSMQVVCKGNNRVFVD